MKLVKHTCPRCLNKYSHEDWYPGSPCPECHASDLEHVHQTGKCGGLSCERDPTGGPGSQYSPSIIGMRSDVTWHGTKFS